jgi:Fe-S-cluster-containing dehydrogenase component
MMCQHCAEPPCVDVCPTGASFKRADGIVLVDRHTCIGCRYCMMACPYKARSFVHEPLPTRSPTCRAARAASRAARCACTASTAASKPACVEACSRRATAPSCSATSTIRQRDRQARARACQPRQLRADLKLTRRALPGHLTMKPATLPRNAQASGLLAALGGLVSAGGPGAAHYMEVHGHVVTGMNNQVVWGLPHVFAIFMIVAASGVLNVASIGSVFGQPALQAARAAVGPAQRWPCWPAA